jgi:hypothetical protein
MKAKADIKTGEKNSRLAKEAIQNSHEATTVAKLSQANQKCVSSACCAESKQQEWNRRQNAYNVISTTER